MHPINPTILSTATDVAYNILDRGNPPESTYPVPVPVGNRFLYLSTERDNIIGPDSFELEGTVFYLGFNRAEVT